MTRRLLMAADAAIAATVAYALTLADGWPFSAETHLALARAGLTTADLSPHPLWGRAVAAFGLNAGTISVLAGGLAVGLLAWNVSRLKGWAAGLVAAMAFAFAPTVWRASTHVGAAPFDMALLLLALTFAGGRKRWLRLPLALATGGLLVWDMAFAGLADWRSALLGGMTMPAILAAAGGMAFGSASKAQEQTTGKPLLWALVLCALAMPVIGLFSSSRKSVSLAEFLATEMLAKAGHDVKWLVADDMLEDALTRQLAVRGSGPFLVCPTHERDEPWLTNLVRRVEAEYPGNERLRIAATIGVMAFLDELPLADTNRAAVAVAWQRDWWPREEREKLVAKAKARTGGEADPLWEYVREQLDRLSRPPSERTGRFAAPTRVNAMVDRFAAGLGTNGLERMRGNARDLLRVDRMNPLGNAVLGVLSARDGNLIGAEILLERAVACGRAPPLVCNDYAETLRRLGRLDEAERMARRAVGMAPLEWRAWETLADVLTCQDASEAEIEHALSRAEHLSEGVKEEEKCTLVYLRARQLKHKGRNLLADELLRKVIRMNPGQYLRERVEACLD